MSNKLETAILSWCIVEPQYIDKLIERGLREEHFQDGRYKALWRVMALGVGVDKGDGYFDLPRAFSALSEASKKEWGSVVELSKLIDTPDRGASGEAMLFESRTLIDGFKKNQVLSRIKSAYVEMEGSSDWQKVWAKLELEVASLISDTGPTLRHAAELLENFLIPTGEPKERIKVCSGIKTLDESFLRPEGKVIYLGARTGVGKSALAQQIAVKTAEAGTPVAVFSYEMTQDENGGRLAQYCAKIHGDRVWENDWTNDECARVFNAAEKLRKMELYIESNKSKTFEELLADIRRLRRVKNIKVVFIDYLTLLKSSVKSFSRREELERICTDLQNFVKETGICCFVLAQLNRDVKNSLDKPNLTHFKDTGQIEQSADIAILLSRVNDDSRYVLADFAKVRFGKRREVYLDVEPETLTYKEGVPPTAPIGAAGDIFADQNNF